MSPGDRGSGRVDTVPGEPALVRRTLIGLGAGFLLLLLVLPVVAVFATALQKGLGASLQALRDTDTLAAIRLTLFTAAVSVPINILFGVAAAWAVAKFDFRGKTLLVSLIDVPFSVSPVISGMIFVLLFGAQGVLGPWLAAHDLKIVFAVPGIVIATTFVTLPFVARELIPLMQSQGREDEEAALSLGASGWQTFFRVTLPNITWGLIYGVILCNARALGEFGAVSVISGHLRGSTTTAPLHVEILYNEYKPVAAFTVAGVLVALAVLTIVAKNAVEWRAVHAGDPVGRRQGAPAHRLGAAAEEA
jgi:sulfate transport system permease protein